MCINEFLDLLRVNILTAADNHILQTACNSVIAFLRSAGKIACVQPTVLVDRRGCCLRHLIVTLHNIISAGYKLSDDLVRTILAGLGIHDLALDFRESASDGRDADFQRIRRAAHRAAR